MNSHHVDGETKYDSNSDLEKNKVSKKEKKLLKDMETLQLKLASEEGLLFDKLYNQGHLEKIEYDVRYKKYQMKVLKNGFLKSVIGRHENYGESLSVCVKEATLEYSDEQLFSIVAGTFSRVKSLLKDVLGNSRTFDVVFGKPKKDLTGLKGDNLLLAKLENLKIDLYYELHSILPIINKERKQLKYQFLTDLLVEYKSSKKESSSAELSQSYRKVYDKLNSETQLKLKSGLNSRLAKLLQVLETNIEMDRDEASANDRFENINNTSNNY